MGGSQPGSSGGELQILNGERAEGGLSNRATLVPHISWISEISIVTKTFCSSSFLIQRVARFPLCSHSWLRDYLSAAQLQFTAILCAVTGYEGEVNFVYAAQQVSNESKEQQFQTKWQRAELSWLVAQKVPAVVGASTPDLWMELFKGCQPHYGENSQPTSDQNWKFSGVLDLHNLHNAVLSFAQQYAAATDPHKRFPDMGWHPVIAALLKTDNI